VKKLLIAAALALALVPLSLGAQTTGNTGFQLLSIDIGYGASWNLADNNNNELIMPTLFGLNFRVADNLSAGIQSLTVPGTASTDNFFILKYNFLPQARATLGFGAQKNVSGTATAASSIGFEIIPFSRSVGGQAATEFKIIAKYDSSFAELTKGKILFALALGIGF
jgi:hypothetical protein